MLLTWIDYTIIAIILASTIIGLIRGFIKEALSLVIWIVAFIIAIRYASLLSELFASNIHNVSLRLGMSYVILLIAVLIIGMIFNFLLGKLVAYTGLGGTNRLLGLVFGFLRGIVLVAGLILLAQLTELPKTSAWQHAVVLPHFEPLSIWLKSFIPTNVEQYFQFTNLTTTTQQG